MDYRSPVISIDMEASANSTTHNGYEVVTKPLKPEVAMALTYMCMRAYAALGDLASKLEVIKIRPYLETYPREIESVRVNLIFSNFYFQQKVECAFIFLVRHLELVRRPEPHPEGLMESECRQFIAAMKNAIRRELVDLSDRYRSAQEDAGRAFVALDEKSA